MFVPWLQQPWGNVSFNYPNEIALFPRNSTVGQLLAIIDLMKQEAENQGIANNVPILQPSEFGYAYAIGESASSGWAFIHAACITQSLLHMRSLPLALYVRKAFVLRRTMDAVPNRTVTTVCFVPVSYVRVLTRVPNLRRTVILLLNYPYPR